MGLARGFPRLPAQRVAHVPRFRRADAALDIASGLAPLWHARASDSAHARLMDRAIDLADEQGIQTAALAEVLLWSGVIGIRVLDTDRADHYLERLKRGEEQARALADDRLIMLAAHCRVTTTVMTRDIERGVRATEEGLDIADAPWRGLLDQPLRSRRGSVGGIRGRAGQGCDAGTCCAGQRSAVG